MKPPCILSRAATAAALAILCMQPVAAGWHDGTEKRLVAEADAWVKDKPPQLQRILHTLYMEGEWNAVLNFDLLALAALEIHRPDVAARSLDMANSRILRVYANDPAAMQARSLWSAESVKDFKGEPYERAMSFYYRGLLYLQSGDYQNARASFRQADLQNAFGQYETNNGNTFAFMQWLSAWTSQCDGDRASAKEAAGRATAQASEPFLRAVGTRLPAHLAIFEVGSGPEKVTLGDAHSLLGFLAQPDNSGAVRAVYGHANLKPVAQGAAASLDQVAMTRGGRPIQGILDGKAVFKENAGAVADTANAISSGLMQSALQGANSQNASLVRGMGTAGAALSLIGAAAGTLSKSVNPEADTRYWATMPKTIYVEAYETAPPGVPSFATAGTPQPRPVLLEGRHGQCSFVWSRELSALAADDGGVANPSPWPAQPVEDGREATNAAFRASLQSLFDG